MACQHGLCLRVCSNFGGPCARAGDCCYTAGNGSVCLSNVCSPGSASTAAGATAGGGSTGSTGTSASTGSTGGTSGSTSAATSSATGSGSTSGSTGSTGSTGSDPAHQFCDEALDALCEAWQHCGKVDTNCATLLRATIGQPGNCGAPGEALDLTNAPGCLAALWNAADGGASCRSTDDLASVGGAPCEHVFRGTVTEGGPCQADGQCLDRPDGGPARCVFPPGLNACGTCSTGDLGQPCAPGPFCLTGYCASASRTCTPWLAEGVDCSLEPGGCDPTADSCLRNPADGGQSCLPTPPTGNACLDNLDCGEQDYCCGPDDCPSLDGGSFCVNRRQPGAYGCSDDRSCVAGTVCQSGYCLSEHPRVGDPCFFTVCQSGYCYQTNGGYPGVCVPNAELNENCNRCDPALQCLSGSCQALPSAGQPCAGVSCTGGDSCDQGICRPLGLLGDACTVVDGRSSCGVGYCDATGHCVPFLAPGSACDPALGQCSALDCPLRVLPDGGIGPVCVDPGCQSLLDGGHVCAGPVCP